MQFLSVNALGIIPGQAIMGIPHEAFREAFRYSADFQTMPKDGAGEPHPVPIFFINPDPGGTGFGESIALDHLRPGFFKQDAGNRLGNIVGGDLLTGR